MEEVVLNLLQGAHDQIFNVQSDTEFKWSRIKYDPLFNPNIQITFIEDSRFFQHDQYKWLWYKNLNLPSLSFSVSLLPKIDEKLNIDAITKNLVAELFSFRELSQEEKTDETKTLLTLTKLQGNTMVKFENEQAIISGVKFTQTSYNLKGLKFGLIILLRDQNLNIFDARVSPFIFVESRKKSHSERQSDFNLFDPFLPESLEKNLVKINPKSNESIFISEDLEGLQNYFTAYSIRHKILHPFFLLLKFPQAIRLFYNTNYVSEKETSAIFIRVQKQIYSTLIESQDQQNQKDKENFASKVLILCLNIPPALPFSKLNSTVKRIIRFIKPLHGPALAFSQTLLVDIPSNFIEFKYNEELKAVYKKQYSKLASQKMYLNYSKTSTNCEFLNQSNQNEEQLLFEGENHNSNNVDTIDYQGIQIKALHQSVFLNPLNNQERLENEALHQNINQQIQPSFSSNHLKLNSENPQNLIRSILLLNEFSQESRSKLQKCAVYHGRNNLVNKTKNTLQLSEFNNESQPTNNLPLHKKQKIFDSQTSKEKNMNASLKMEIEEFSQENQKQNECHLEYSVNPKKDKAQEQEFSPSNHKQQLIKTQDFIQINESNLSDSKSKEIVNFSNIQETPQFNSAEKNSQNLVNAEVNKDEKECSSSFQSQHAIDFCKAKENQQFSQSFSQNEPHGQNNRNDNNQSISPQSNFNPFYCFMLQQQQILQLQQSYIQELEKNASLTNNKNKFFSSSSNHSSSQDSIISNNQKDNSSKNESEQFSFSDSSSKRKSQIQQNSSSTFYTHAKSPPLNNKLPFIPSQNQIKELYEIYSDMANKQVVLNKSKELKLKNQCDNYVKSCSTQNQQNTLYFENILLPLFQNTNEFITKDSMNQQASNLFTISNKDEQFNKGRSLQQEQDIFDASLEENKLDYQNLLNE